MIFEIQFYSGTFTSHQFPPRLIGSTSCEMMITIMECRDMFLDVVARNRKCFASSSMLSC